MTPSHSMPPPETLFVWLASVFGLLLVALTPPLAGPDELFHYQRTAGIAYGYLLNTRMALPSGIATFMHAATAILTDPNVPGLPYSAASYRTLAAIPLSGGAGVALEPNFFTIHNPLCYLPQAVAFRIGASLGLTPLTLLYVARLSGLAAGIALTFLAIRRMPSQRYALCFLALLPNLTVYRSVLNADSVGFGLCFLLVACIYREALKCEALTAKTIALFAALVFVQAQCKSAYLLLPLLALAIPAGRFASRAQRATALAVILLPGILASIAWALVMKLTYFTAGMQYQTLSGTAFPDGQTALILHHPLTYAHVLYETFLSPPFLKEFISGVTGSVVAGQYLPLPLCALATGGLIAVLAFDRPDAAHPYPAQLRWLGAGIFCASTLLALTFLYLQWTRLGGNRIDGFQGRYLYPLFPLLFPLIRSAPANASPRWLATLVPVVSGCLLCVATLIVKQGYFG